jgi:Carboxypeptidase regulatory-like domain
MFRLFIALTLIASLFLPLTAAAQSSSLSGTVLDAQGALIPGVVITATNTDTAVTRSTISDEMGAYAFAQLPPGTYKVQAELPGFTTSVMQVRLQIDTPAILGIKMEVGAVTDTVNVLGDVATVNTENATIGNPFTETQVKQIPLQTRNVVELLSLQPGVTPTGEVIGARKDQNNVTLDGVDVNDNQSALALVNSDTATATDIRNASGFKAALPVPLDSVQEFRTTVAGQGAEQGRSSGGQVSLVTKSGSNSLHGSAYEFLRNRLTAANNWFNNRAGIPRENLIRNQYGASLGGPVIKNRAFFFANWEDRKDRSATSTARQVPSELLKQGILQFRQSNGQIGKLTADDIKAVDPLHIGISPAQLQLLSQYPAGNDPASGSDKGLNFYSFRFNAPQNENDRALVAKLDFNLDHAAKHTLMLRGTLADNHQVTAVAQFPGQLPASQALDRSKGIAGRYTYVISPSKINVFSFGYTRLNVEQSGSTGASLTFVVANLTPTTRASTRILPTTNFVDDMTWIKGKHKIEFGANLRFIENDRTSYANSFPSYSFSRNTLLGLGADINADLNAYIQQQSGNSSLKASESTNVANGFGVLLGLVNQYGATYNYARDGSAIPFGAPTVRAFAANELDFYVQDTWKARRDLTLTYGVRYSLNGVPYEKNGLEVVTTTPLETFLAERIYAQAHGIPGFAMPNAKLTYQLGGPKNNGPGWFDRDTNNFAPRFNIAYAPVSDGGLGKLFGKGSVIRAGAAVLYDRYGSDMVVNFDKSGSPGLSNSVSQPLNTDFTSGFRYTGGALPALPAAPTGGFPFTPPTIIGGFGATVGVDKNLVAPYSVLLNTSYTRPIARGLTVELGYFGRLGRKGLLQQDFMQMLTHFTDPVSGMDWAQAMGILRGYYESGLTPAQVQANPTIIPKIPYIENIFGKAAGITPPGSTIKLSTPGSATANYFITTYGTYASSDLDALNQMDRIRLSDGTCITVYGCNTFFALQNAGLKSWVNASNAAFHGGQLVIRRAVAEGWGFDFNYTLSHSIDIQSASESGAGTSGAVIQDTFNPKSSRTSSDFDIRHNISANTVIELPIGAGKPFLGKIPGWANEMIGGWQVSSLIKYRSGMPLNISNGGVYPTNYLNAALVVVRPGMSMPANGVGYDQTGTPSLFRNTNATQSFMGQYPGSIGTRNILRGAPFKGLDLAVSKSFPMPWEHQRIQFRAEAFNALNNVNFNDPSSITLSSPSTFGQFSSAQPPRVMQFALRYEF